MNSCILVLGSNDNPELSLGKIRHLLLNLFPDIVFGQEKKTMPIGVPPDTPWFINQLAKLHTPLPLDLIKEHLKNIEEAVGRTPLNNINNIIPADIDILCFNDEIIKPEDYQRTFVQELLQEF